MKIANRTFVISGGSSGLGQATALLLHDADAYVAILDQSDNDELLQKLGRRGRFFQIDILNHAEVEKAVEDVVSWAKETGAPLGGVVNCAGVGAPSKMLDARGNLHSLDLWNFVIGINLTGSFNLTRLVVKHLAEVQSEGPDAERGVIIFVSSSAAFEGQAGQAAYAASKGGLNSMVLPLARDLGRRGIRVNSIAPGAFSTAMTGGMSEKAKASVVSDLLYPHRMGEPGEFASLVKFMIENSYMNGEVVRLSGGARLPGRL